MGAGVIDWLGITLRRALSVLLPPHPSLHLVRTRPQSRPWSDREPVCVFGMRERGSAWVRAGGRLARRKDTHTAPNAAPRRASPSPYGAAGVPCVLVCWWNVDTHRRSPTPPLPPTPSHSRTLWSAAWGALSYTATTASRLAGCQVPLKPMKSMRAATPVAVPGKWRSRVWTPEKRVTLHEIKGGGGGGQGVESVRFLVF